MSWLCKSCGCENGSQSNKCKNCGEFNKKVILSKNIQYNVNNQNRGTQGVQNTQRNVNNQNRATQGVQNTQHSVNNQNRATQGVQSTQHSVNNQNRATQRVQSTQHSVNNRNRATQGVQNYNRNVNVSMAENRKKKEDLILKIALILVGIFVVFLLMVFIMLLRRNNNDSSMVDSSKDTNITLNTYFDEYDTSTETTIYTTVTDESTTTTQVTTDTTTETTIIESTTPVTTVQESAIVLTVAPTEIVTKPVETALITTIQTTSEPVDNSVGHAYSSNFVTYYNDRFMYSVKYPDNFYTSFESSNSDGCELTDGCATIRLYSSYNIYDDSSKTAYNYAVNNISQDMYYELVKDNFYIISWVENGNVMYRKVFVNDRITTLEFEYSTEYKNIYDKMITEMVLTFSVD